MKNLFIHILIAKHVLLNCFIAIGQPVFKKNYDYAALNKISLLELPSGHFLTGITGASVIDNGGNIIHSSSFVFIPMLEMNSLLNYSLNKFVLDGTSLDSCNSIPVELPLLAIIDSNGNVISQRSFKLNGNCSNKTVYSSVTLNGGIISVGRCELPNCEKCWTGDYFALCVDSLFNLKWGKCFTGHWGGAQFSKQTPDGGFLLGFNLDTAGAVVAKTDSMGNIIWCKSYIRPKGYIHDCVIEQDGSSIITGFTDSVDIPPNGQYPPNFAPKLFMIKLDTTGSVLWAKAFDSDRHWLMAPSRIVKTIDGGYTILGAVAYNPSIKPILIKTDANGDTLWTRIHGEASGFYYPVSLLYTSDHGYLLGGDNSLSIWLYKTDSLGNVPCNTLQQPTYVYPIFPTDSNVVLTTIDGAVEVTVNISDTVYPPHNVWNECDYTNVPYSLSQTPATKIYPNPTTGKLVLEFTGPLTSDCYFSVYDYTGRLIFQRMLYTDKEKIEVDLSPYGKGLYLVEFTEKEQVSVKKVVVE